MCPASRSSRAAMSRCSAATQRQAEFGIGGAGLAGQAAAFGRQAQRQLAVFKQFVRAGGPGFVAQVEAGEQVRRAATQRAQLPVQPPPAQPLVGAATVAGGGEQAVAQGPVSVVKPGRKPSATASRRREVRTAPRWSA